jgi:hypothetical protein
MARKTTEKKSTEKKPIKLDAKTTRTLLIVGGIAVAVLALVFLVPLLGGGDAIAARMPASTAFYVHLDLAALNAQGMHEIIAAFQEAAGVDDTAEPWQNTILEELNVDFDEDVKPWIGTQLGFAVIGEESAQLNSFNVPAFAIIQSRDNAAADAFITKLVENAENDGETVSTVDHNGITIYAIHTAGFTFDGGEEIGGSDQAIARSGSLVYFASSAEALKTYLELAPADSLSNSANYKKVSGQFGGGNLATFYMSFGSYMDMVTAMSMGVSPLTMTPGLGQYSELMESMVMAGSAKVVKEGIRIDYSVAMDETKIPEAARQIYANNKSGLTTTIHSYPEDTVFFVGAKSSAGGWDPELMKEVMGEDAYNDYIESMDLLTAEIGLDLRSFMESVGGEASFGVFPQHNGVGLALGLGFQMMVSSKDDTAFSSFLTDLNDLLVESTFTPTTQRTINGMSAYVVSDPSMGDVLAFGSGSGYGFFTTDPAMFDDSDGGDFASLDQSALYQQTWKSFSGSSIPVFYLDMRGFLDALAGSQAFASMGSDASDTFAGIHPITVIAGASQQGGGLGGGQATFIIFIER